MLFEKNFYLNATRMRTASYKDLSGTQQSYQWDSVNSTRFDARVSVTDGNNLCKQIYTNSKWYKVLLFIIFLFYVTNWPKCIIYSVSEI